MARVAAAKPPLFRGFGFFDFFSIGFVAPTTCKSSICLTTCKGEGLSTWENPSIHGQMWKTAPDTKNWVL